MEIYRRAAICLAFQCLATFAWASDFAPSEIETKLKASYLLKFASYIEWPETAFARPDAPVIIGVLNADEIGAELARMQATLPPNERAIEVKLLRERDPLPNLHILFIGNRAGEKLKILLDGMTARPVLTVTETAGGLDRGSMINFIPVDDRIRFEVSLNHADASGIRINARLLKVAQKIDTRRP